MQVLAVDYASASSEPVPKSVKSVDQHLFRDEWRKADQDEIDKLCGMVDQNIKVLEKVPRSTLSHVQRQGAMTRCRIKIPRPDQTK